MRRFKVPAAMNNRCSIYVLEQSVERRPFVEDAHEAHRRGGFQ
jgi:hypothetical protein